LFFSRPDEWLLPILDKVRFGSIPEVQAKEITSHQCPDLPWSGSRPRLEPTVSEYSVLAYFVVQLRVHEAAMGLLGHGENLLYDLPFLAL
jgi:hypothetical protein